MTSIPVLDARGLAVGQGELAAAIAEQPIKQHLIHETVVAELAARRLVETHHLLKKRLVDHAPIVPVTPDVRQVRCIGSHLA